MNQIELIVEEINDIEKELEYQDKEFMALESYILNKEQEPVVTKRPVGRPKGCKDTKARVYKTEYDENGNLLKKTRGRPKLASHEKKKPVRKYERCGRPCKENKIIQDKDYHRNYYQEVVSKKVVECEYCNRVVIKAKLGVHQKTKYCMSHQH